jgi:hypothetical protein
MNWAEIAGISGVAVKTGHGLGTHLKIVIIPSSIVT